MNQGPYNRRSSSRRRSDLAKRQRFTNSNPRSDSNIRNQYEKEGRRYDSFGPTGGGININSNSIAILAGVLVIGVGIGSLITSTTSGGQGNIASQQQLDMAVPDPDFCRQYGASAFVIDVEMYTTLNPSTSFVTQPALQPGCVIRRENWTVLQKQGAINNEDVRECKQRMNTFAYIGSIRDQPIVRCVYQADVNENKFIIKGAEEDAVGINKEAIQF